MSSIFISHASKDDALAEVVERILKENGFDDYFIDHNSILIGDKWAQALRNAAQSCRIVICLVTENWLSSNDCYGEFMAAYYMGKRIMPLFWLRSSTGGSVDSHARLQRVRSEDQGYDLSDLDLSNPASTVVPDDLKGKLVAALRAGGAIGEVGLDPGAFAVDTTARPSPFPGLQSFEDTDADAAIFYGRSLDIARCLEDIRRMRADGEKRIFALVGASGSGKSSLLKAGVLPRLRRERGWIALRSFTPTSDPLLEFSSILLGISDGRDHELSAGRVRDDLLGVWNEARRDPKLGREQVGRLLSKALLEIIAKLYAVEDDRDVALLVTVDQAEQLLRLQSPENTAFCDYIQALVLYADQAVSPARALPSRYMVAMTLRSDNLDEFQSSHLFAGLRLKAVDIRPVSSFRLTETIEGPAKRYHVSIDRGLLDNILQNIPEKDPLPLVAFMLERMWRLYRQGNELPASAYEAMGGLDNLLASAAERALAGLAPDDEKQPVRPLDQRMDATASRIFVPPLAQVDNRGATIRRTAIWSNFGSDARAILERFIAWRLVAIRPSAAGEHGGESAVEVAHEALFRSWPRLATWISHEKRFLQELRDLQDAAQDWNREQRRPEFCVHQKQRLHSAQRLFDIPHFAAQFLPLDKEYLAACISRRRRGRLGDVAIGIAVGIALIATALAFDTWFSREKMSLIAAQLIHDGYPAKSAKFSVAGAFDQTDLLRLLGGAGGGSALKETGLSFPVVFSLARDFSASDFRLLKNGKRLFVSSSDDAGGLWNLDTKKLMIDLSQEGKIKDFFLTNEEDVLFTRGADDSMSVWDTSSGKQIFSAPAKTMNSGSWNSASKRLLTLSEDGTCVLWNLTIGLQIGPIGDVDGTEQCKIFGTATQGRVATRSSKGIVEIWDAMDRHRISTISLEASTSGISDIVKNFVLLVSSISGRVSLYDTLSGNLIMELPTARVLEWRFSSDGERLVTRSVGNAAMLWNARTGQQIGTLGNVTPSQWEFSPDGQIILTRTAEGGATIWSAQSAQPMLTLPGPGLRTFKFSSKGNRLAVIAYEGAATLWNVDPDPGLPGDRKLADLAGKGQSTTYADEVAFSANGKWLSVKSDSSPGAIWNVVDPKKAIRIRPLANGDGGGAFSDDETVYASSGTNNDGSLFRDGVKVAKLGGSGAVYDVRVSSDGNRVATSSTASALVIWNTARAIKDDTSTADLRRQVCIQNYDYIGTFERVSVDDPEEPAYEVRNFAIGRPWNPCDWRGLQSWEGWRQTLRYLLVHTGLYRDYSCGEVAAFSGGASRSRECASVVSDDASPAKAPTAKKKTRANAAATRN